jgi:hypothetical protein
MGNDDDLLGSNAICERRVYESSINQREAEAVTRRGLRLMRAYPQHSIASRR